MQSMLVHHPRNGGVRMDAWAGTNARAGARGDGGRVRAVRGCAVGVVASGGEPTTSGHRQCVRGDALAGGREHGATFPPAGHACGGGGGTNLLARSRALRGRDATRRDEADHDAPNQ
jgi:hypothetical protein